MASTNKTSNIGLSQWVLTDPPLMDDFNEDHRKIDTAVTEAKQVAAAASTAATAAAAANPWVKLIDVTTTAAASTVELNLSGINRNDYLTLRVYVEASNTSYLYLRLNALTTGYYVWLFTASNPISNGYSYIWCYGNWAEIDLCHP